MPFSADPLPSECSERIFSYLDLKDCLSLGSTSTGSLKEILPDLNRRRRKMKERFAYYRDWKTSGLEKEEKLGLWEDVMAKHPNLDWVLVPTVEERVHQLSQRLPKSHPLHETVLVLRQKLAVDFDEDGIVHAPRVYTALFSLLKFLTCELKLHAKILSDVLHSEPVSVQEKTDSASIAISLDRYIGDVFCVSYLIDQSNLGLVEGGPTSAIFVKELRRQQEISSCYRSWVYMHSQVLRVKSFDPDKRKRLGIPEFSGVSEMIPNDCYVNDYFMSSKMTLVFDEFGPLGPAFRGRDVVRLRCISARCLFAFLITSNSNGPGETSRSALEWLCLVHEETRKVRPMTVRAPAVRLRSHHEEGND